MRAKYKRLALVCGNNLSRKPHFCFVFCMVLALTLLLSAFALFKVVTVGENLLTSWFNHPKKKTMRDFVYQPLFIYIYIIFKMIYLPKCHLQFMYYSASH